MRFAIASILLTANLALAQDDPALRCEHDPLTAPNLQYQLDWPTYNTPNQCPQGMEIEYTCRLAAYAAYWSAIWSANDTYRDAVCACWTGPAGQLWLDCMYNANHQFLLACEAARAAYESAIKACNCVVVDP